MRLLKYFIFLIFAIVISCYEKEILKVGINVWPGYEPIYVAKEKGFLDKNIQLIEFGSASQVIRAYRRGLLNGAGLTLDEVIFLKSLGFSPKIILVADVSNGADALIVRPYIKSLKDLKGKKIGVENTALGAFFLSRILEKAGLNEKDIKVIPLEVNEHYKAFIENEVDAVITFEPVKTRLLKKGGIVLFDSSKIPNEIVDVFAIEEEFLKSSPEIVKNFVKSYFDGLKLIKSNKDEIFTIIAKREKISIEDLKKSYKDLKLPDLDENIKILNSSMKNTILKITEILREKGLIKKDFNINPNELIEIKFLIELRNG